MRFAFITTMLGAPWGGSEELWFRTALQLKSGGHEVCALTAYRSLLSDKFLGLTKQGIAIRTYPAPSYVEGPYRYSWHRMTLGSRRAYAWLKRFSPDLVVISQGEIAGGLEWARVCREASIPYVMIVHCNSEFLWFEKDVVDSAVAAYTSARNVFCVSRGNLQMLRLQVGEPLPNAEIVWNPYNVSTEASPAWPVDDGRWRIACVARLDPAAKGQDILLQVLARPEWRDRPVELSFFGEGSYEVALRRIASMLRLNNVHFRGHVSDVRAIWEQHHILALSSRYEGLPLVIVETMWCGRPAIVTDVAGNAELCMDGKTGFVAQSPTLAAFAETMERAWNARADWNQMGQAARTIAETMIPKDPISLFCARLQACAAGTSDPAPAKLDVVADAEKVLQ
jgi:glycosyltransferase involved in cell wall biosynthesis